MIKMLMQFRSVAVFIFNVTVGMIALLMMAFNPGYGQPIQILASVMMLISIIGLPVSLLWAIAAINAYKLQLSRASQ